MYLRFATTETHPDSRKPQGVFMACADLMESGTLTQAEIDEIDDTLAWFNENIPVPSYKKFGKECVFWFKAGAKEAIRRMWQVVNILRAYDVVVLVLRAEYLRTVPYEDEFQVAASHTRLDRFRIH